MAKKKEEKQREWKRPCDIHVTRTANPKTMLYKYLAEDVCKTWTEDFIDEDTKELVSIERKEKLFERGRYLDKETVSKVQFSIQAEEITEVLVCDTRYDAERFIGNGFFPWEVSVSAGEKKFLYLTRAQSVEQAITIATEYAGMYLGLSGWFGVKQVKHCDYKIIEDSDECIPENAPDDYNADYDYFKVTVQSRFYCDLDEDVEKESYTYIIKAQDVGEAKERITEFCKKLWEKELDRNPRNSFIVLKAQPYDTDGIVPLEYCKLYRQESEADNK
jgi:hypothetical protein